jgi:hypothetical protein
MVLVAKLAFAARGEVAVATRTLAGRGGDFDQVSEVIDQESGPTEMSVQPKRAAMPLGDHALGF